MKDYLNLVKFPHTVFALPFALLGFFVAIHTQNLGFSFNKFALILLCMVFARNAAMGFNRYLDRDIDGLNARTRVREIPSGKIGAKAALMFSLGNAFAFIVCTYFINQLCFFLSPVALLIILGYSYTKRFTSYCHVILGLGLSLAPIGAYLAVHPNISWLPVMIGLTVMFWVSGFDIIYALQDEEFDKQKGLFSIPATFGKKRALFFSRILHFLSAVCLIITSVLIVKGTVSSQIFLFLGSIFFISSMIYQHKLVKPEDLSNINLAFFTTNGIASVVFCSLAILDFYV